MGKYNYDKIGNVQQVKQLRTNGVTRNFVYNNGVNTIQQIKTGSSTFSTTQILALFFEYKYDEQSSLLLNIFLNA